MAMQKDEQGIWSVTTPPLAPDYYGYSFVADGIRLIESPESATDTESTEYGKRRACPRALVTALGTE